MVTISPYTKKPIAGKSAAAQRFIASQGSGGGRVSVVAESKPAGEVVVQSTTVKRNTDGSREIIKTYSDGRVETSYKDARGNAVSARPVVSRLMSVSQDRGVSVRDDGGGQTIVQMAAADKKATRATMPTPQVRYERKFAALPPDGRPLRPDQVRVDPGVLKYTRPATLSELVDETKARSVARARVAEKERLLAVAQSMPARSEMVIAPGRVRVTLVNKKTGEVTSYEENKIADGFFSGAGQKQRVSNVGGVMSLAGQSVVQSLSFGAIPKWKDDAEIQANVGDRSLRRGLEFVSQNPAETALIATGVTGLLRGAAGVAAGSGAKQSASQAVKFAPRAGRFAWAGARTLALGEGARFASEEIGAAMNKEQKLLMKEQGRLFEDATKAGFRGEEAGVKKQVWYKQAAYEVPILNIFAGSKSDFEKGLREYYASQGLTKAQIDASVQAQLRERKVRGVGEGVGFLTSSASVEAYGRKEVGLVFGAKEAAGQSIPKKRFGWEMFKLGFVNIAPAGFIEGSVQERVQQSSRSRESDNLQVGLMGGFGAMSAGLIGGGIMGLSKRPIPQKVVELGAYIADPFEKPGDLLADVSEVVGRRVFKRPRLPVPVIVETITPDQIFKFGTTTKINTEMPKPAGNRGKKKQSSDWFFGTWNPGTSVPAVTPSTVPSEITPGKFVPPVVPAINVPAVPFSFTPSTPVPPVVPVQSIPAQTPVNVPVSTPTSILTSVPVYTPIGRLPPPLLLPPMGFPGGSSGAGRRGGRPVYVNELAAGLSLMGSLLGGGVGRSLQEQAAPGLVLPKKKKKKKKAKGVPQAPMFEFDFPIMMTESKKKKKGVGVLPFKLW